MSIVLLLFFLLLTQPRRYERSKFSRTVKKKKKKGMIPPDKQRAFRQFNISLCFSESRNAEQPRVSVRAHRQASSASLFLRQPDSALLPAPAAEPAQSQPHGRQQYPGPGPELRPHPGQRRGPAYGHHPGGHQQRLSPRRGGPVRRFPNRRSLLVGYEILLRGSDRTETTSQGPAAPEEAGMCRH